MLFLLLVEGGSFSCSRTPQQNTNSPVSEHVQRGYGGVLTLATGSDPSGRDLLVAGGYNPKKFCCFDSWVLRLSPASGHLVWKVRFPGIRGMVNSTALDSTGNVFVGRSYSWPIFYFSLEDDLISWEHFLLDDRDPPLVTKLSGIDGSILWEWRNPAVSSANLLRISRVKEFSKNQFEQEADVIPDRFGKAWVAGVRGDKKGMQTRYLTMLDAQTGKEIWSRDSSAYYFVLPASVLPLADGDAVVVWEPSYNEDWICERVRASDGSVAWKKEIPSISMPGRFPRRTQKIQWVIDETRRQIAFFWDEEGPRLCRMLGNSEACDLVTGATKWRNSFKSDERSYRGSDRFATLEPGGDFVLWDTWTWYSSRINWGKWGKTFGIWLPEGESIFHLRPYRTTISGANGRELKREPIGREGEELSNVVAPPGEPDNVVLFLRQNAPPPGPDPWRAQRMGRALSPCPSGPAFDDSAPVVITPSGRIITTHQNRDDDDECWLITIW